MTRNQQLDELQDKIQYRFKDISLLEVALTHSSFAHDKQVQSYERMEFFGDTILGFVISEKLYQLYPNEDESMLSTMRKAIVSGSQLEKVVVKRGFYNYVLVNKGLIAKKIKSDVFESLTAAIYLDSDMSEARKFVLRELDGLIDNVRDLLDFKTFLKEYCEKKGAEKLDYKFETINIEGPSHSPQITVELIIDGKSIATVTSSSRVEAEQECAKIWYKNLLPNDKKLIS